MHATFIFCFFPVLFIYSFTNLFFRKSHMVRDLVLFSLLLLLLLVIIVIISIIIIICIIINY